MTILVIKNYKKTLNIIVILPCFTILTENPVLFNIKNSNEKYFR